MSFHFIFVTNFIRDKNPLYGTFQIFPVVHAPIDMSLAQ